MKIPHTVNINTFNAYQPSDEAKSLLSEKGRTLKSEDLRWNEEHLPRLTELCVRVLVEGFEKRQILLSLPCNDKNLLLETLALDLPLSLVTKYLDDGIYWKRMVAERWNDRANHIEDYGFSWKRLYMERHCQEVLESTTPENFELNVINALCKMVCDYVHKLDLRQLQMSEIDACREEEEDDSTIEIEPRNHINLGPVIHGLHNLVQLHIRFGVRDVGSDYKKIMFQFTIADCRNIGAGIVEARALKLLKIHHCALDDDRVIALLSQMTSNKSLEELDFSHCIISNEGAAAIAKFIRDHKGIKKLNLCNNKIDGKGVSAIAFVTNLEDCSPIEDLNLKLNSIGDEGGRYMASVLLRGVAKIKHLNMSCCCLGEESAVLTGEMLSHNITLISLDLSNNNLGELGGQALEVGLSQNKILQYLDVRMTGISKLTQININKYLHINRLRARKGDLTVDRELQRLAKVEEEENIRVLREEKLLSVIEEDRSSEISAPANSNVSEPNE